MFPFLKTQGQDAQFSQFYANPMYLNPAFTGLTYEHRVVANYRNQWAGISKAFATYAASYDYNAVEKNMGLGLQVMSDAAGTGGLRNSGVTASLSWRGNITRFMEIRGGVAAGYNFLRLGFDRLVFNDQLYSGSAVSAENSNYAARNYFDLHAGVLITTPEMWAGISAKHLSRPDIDLSNSDGARLPLSLSLHGGYKFVFEKVGREFKKYLSPVLHYKHQKKFDQADVGVYYYTFPMQFGLWYRGIPLKHYASGYANHDALVVLAGFEMQKYNLRVGYSYDFPLSRLIGSTSGSHEVSLIYEIAKKSRKARRVLISTPKF